MDVPFPSSLKASDLPPVAAASMLSLAAATNNIPKASVAAAATAVVKAQKAQFAAKWGSMQKRLSRDKKTSNYF